MSQADVDARKRLAASGDIAGSPLPAGEKLWLLKKAGALDSLNPYSGQALTAGGAAAAGQPAAGWPSAAGACAAWRRLAAAGKRTRSTNACCWAGL